MMFSVRRWPIASSRVQPKRVSAPGLHSVIRPVSSRVTTASSAESMIPRRRLRRLELELDRPTGDEPADLVGDRLEHGEEVVIDLAAHLAAPKLDRGED